MKINSQSNVRTIDLLFIATEDSRGEAAVFVRRDLRQAGCFVGEPMARGLRTRPARLLRCGATVVAWLLALAPAVSSAQPFLPAAVPDPAGADGMQAVDGTNPEAPVLAEAPPPELPPPLFVGLMDLGRGWSLALRGVGVVPEVGNFEIDGYARLTDVLRLAFRVPFRMPHKHDPFEGESHAGPCVGSLSVGIEGVHGRPFPGWRFGWELRARFPTAESCHILSGNDFAAAVSWFEFPGSAGSGGGIEARAGVGGSWPAGFVQLDVTLGVTVLGCGSTDDDGGYDDEGCMGFLPRIGIAAAAGVRFWAGLALTAEVRGIDWMAPYGLAPQFLGGLRWEGSSLTVGVAAGVAVQRVMPVVEGSVGLRF